MNEKENVVIDDFDFSMIPISRPQEILTSTFLYNKYCVKARILLIQILLESFFIYHPFRLIHVSFFHTPSKGP